MISRTESRPQEPVPVLRGELALSALFALLLALALLTRPTGVADVALPSLLSAVAVGLTEGVGLYLVAHHRFGRLSDLTAVETVHEHGLVAGAAVALGVGSAFVVTSLLAGTYLALWVFLAGTAAWTLLVAVRYAQARTAGAP